MPVYDYGGIFDYLEDIHFPDNLAARFPPWVSRPYYYYMVRQTPRYFSFINHNQSYAVDGKDWNSRQNLPVIKILAIDTQPIVPTEPVGSDSLEAAADRYVERWDQGTLLASEFFGRVNLSNKFFWRTLGRKFPNWATGFKTGLLQSKPNSPYPDIGKYATDAVTDYFTRWNADSAAYNSHANGVASDGNWNPLFQHSFNVPFPTPTAWQGGGTFSLLAKQLGSGNYWFGPFPPTAWSRFNLLNTQSYCFSYGFGYLDPQEWDQAQWPPRRTSIRIQDGGSGHPPSGISNKWQGFSPWPFIDHQFTLV